MQGEFDFNDEDSPIVNPPKSPAKSPRTRFQDLVPGSFLASIQGTDSKQKKETPPESPKQKQKTKLGKVEEERASSPDEAFAAAINVLNHSPRDEDKQNGGTDKSRKRFQTPSPKQPAEKRQLAQLLNDMEEGPHSDKAKQRRRGQSPCSLARSSPIVAPSNVKRPRFGGSKAPGVPSSPKVSPKPSPRGGPTPPQLLTACVTGLQSGLKVSSPAALASQPRLGLASLDISDITDSTLTRAYEPPHSRAANLSKDRGASPLVPPKKPKLPTTKESQENKDTTCEKMLPPKGSAGGVDNPSRRENVVTNATKNDVDSESDDDDLINKLNLGGEGGRSTQTTSVSHAANVSNTNSPHMRGNGPKKVVSMKLHSKLLDIASQPNQRSKLWTPRKDSTEDEVDDQMPNEQEVDEGSPGKEGSNNGEGEERDKDVDAVTGQASLVFQRSNSKGRLPPLPTPGRRRRRRSSTPQGSARKDAETVRSKLNDMAPMTKHQMLMEKMGLVQTPESQGPTANKAKKLGLADNVAI